MFLLDTDTFTHLLHESPKVVTNVARAVAAGEATATTLITKIEVLRGRLDAVMKANDRRQFLLMQRRLELTEQGLQSITVVPLDDTALAHFDRLRTTKGLKKIGRADLLIASIALGQNATLVTRNTKHFGLVSGLNHVNWVD